MMQFNKSITIIVLLQTIVQGFNIHPPKCLRSIPLAKVSFVLPQPKCLIMSMSNTGESFSNEESVLAADVIGVQSDFSSDIEQNEIDEVRQELIQRYLSFGKTMEHAEKEVDEFLSDPERSAQFMDMRHYARAQANDLGFESAFQIGGAFLIGLAGTVGTKYYHIYKELYPNGDGPIPFI